MTLSLPSEGQDNWDEPLNAALTNLDTRVDAAQADADTAATAAQAALSRANHTGTQSADTITDGATNKVFTATEKTKLAGIATEATANSSDAALRARASHTGTQTASTISDLDAAVDARIAAQGATINAETIRDTIGTALVAGPGITITVDDAGDTITIKQSEVIMLAVSDETTAITTGTAKVTFRMPFAMTLTAVRANLNTASSSGIPTVDINEGGTTILSTKLTIDANEKTSTTAATAAVISDTALADDAEITVDIDVAGTGAKGLKVYLIGTRA